MFVAIVLSRSICIYEPTCVAIFSQLVSQGICARSARAPLNATLKSLESSKRHAQAWRVYRPLPGPKLERAPSVGL
eukprot:6039325-Pleurochrysis_carterae.AAC.1